MSTPNAESVSQAHSPAHAAHVGEIVLDRYHLVRRIGAGGMGVVYLARDERLERDVAVKRIAIENDREARGAREALAAARLSHPGIVALYESGRDDNAVYLVSELLRGSTLDELIRTGELSDRDVVLIGMTLCDALAHAHARGIVHRDVKPSNIICPDSNVDGAGVAKLTDFGIALMADGDVLTRTGDIMGTLAYMAPEQAAGRVATGAADVYALGVVLYEGLSGINPIRADNPAATARRVGSRLPALQRVRRDLPGGLCRAIDAAVVPEPEQRAGLADLRAALAQAVDAVGDEAGPVATDEGVARTARMRTERARRRSERAPPEPRLDDDTSSYDPAFADGGTIRARRLRGREAPEGAPVAGVRASRWRGEPAPVAGGRVSRWRREPAPAGGGGWPGDPAPVAWRDAGRWRDDPAREAHGPHPAEATEEAPRRHPPRWHLRAAAAAAAAALTAAALAWLGPEPPISAAAGSLAVGAIVLVVPRLGWFAMVVTLLVWLTATAPGIALVVAIAAAPVPFLMPRRGVAWSAAAVAPVLGLAGLAGAWPALAGQARRWPTRAALGALGGVWLVLAEALTSDRLLFGQPRDVLARAAWDQSAVDAARDALVPIWSGGTLAIAVLWAIAAALLPVLVRGRSAALDLVATAGWAAALAAATGALGNALMLDPPRGLVAGAVVAGAVAVGARAARGRA